MGREGGSRALAACGPLWAHGLIWLPVKRRLGGDRQLERGVLRARRQSKLSDRWEARMTFPNLPVATVRVARITLRDRLQTGVSTRLAKNLCSRLSTGYRW
jgi:hypothetical protein